MHWLGVHPVRQKLDTYFVTVDALVDISSHAYLPEVMSHHVDSAADTLVAFGIVEFCNNERCYFSRNYCCWFHSIFKFDYFP